MYKIFISSSFHDDFDLGFIEERKWVKQLINDASDSFNLKDISLDGALAYTESTKEKSLQRVEQADMIILFVGTRYGSIRENGKSMTELEYDRAKELDKPMLIYIFPTDKTHPDNQKVQKFIDKIQKDDSARALFVEKELYKDKFKDVLQAKAKKQNIQKKRIEEFCHSFAAHLLTQLLMALGNYNEQQFNQTVKKYQDDIKREKKKKWIAIWTVVVVILFIPIIVYSVMENIKKERIEDIPKKIIDNLKAGGYVGENETFSIDLEKFNKESQIKLNEAQEFFESGQYDKAIAIYDNLLKKDENLSDENRIALYKQRAKVYEKKKDWKKAKEAVVKYIAFLKSLPSDKYNYKIAQAYMHYGQFFYFEGDYINAKKQFEIAKSIFEKSNSSLANENVAWALSWTGDAYKKKTAYLDANKTYHKALSIYLDVRKNKENYKQVNIPWLYSQIGYIASLLNDQNESIKNSTMAIEEYQKINEDHKYDIRIGWCHENLAYSYKNIKRMEKSLFHYQKAIEYYKKVKNHTGIARIYQNIYDTYYQMGSKESKYNDKAKQALENSIKWYKKANKEEKTDKYTINIANNTCDLGWFYQHKDTNYTDAIVDNYTTCIEMKQKLDPQKHLIDVVWSQRNLADYYFSQQEYEKAEKVYKEALRNIEKIVNEYNQTQYTKELAWTYHDVGASIDGHTEGFKGLPYFEKALQIYEKYDITSLNSYPLTLNALQYIYNGKMNFKGVENTAKKLLRYYEKKEDNITRNKAFQYYVLGSSKRVQQKKDALYYLDKSLEIFEQIKSQNKFYASYIPSIIMEKIWYFLDKGDTEKAKKIFEKLTTYDLPEDSIMHAKLLKLKLDKNFDKDKLKQILSTLNLKPMGYIVDLTFRAEEYIKKNELKKGKNLYLQAYRVALNAFNKQPNIYRSILTQIALILANFDNSDNEDDILKQTIDVMHLHHYDQTLDMAHLKYMKAKNRILSNESIALLNDAIRIFEKEKKRKLVCESKYYIAAYYELNALVDKAEPLYKEALQCARTEKDNNLIATINRNLSRIYQKKGWYIVAIGFVLENISILEKYKKSLNLEDYRYQLTGLYNELLSLYIKAFDMDGFYKSYGELNKISKEIIKKWPEELTMRIENLVKTFQESDQPKEAVKFLEYALKTHDAELEDEDKGIYLAILGDLHEAVGNIDRSKEAYRKAIEAYKKVNQSDMDEINQRLIARIEEELKRCIKINEACNRKKYVICTITDENNNTTDKVVPENKCEEGWVEESNIEGQTCSDNDIPQAGEVWLIGSNECPQKIIMADEDEFERYGIEANESVLINAVEPAR